MTGNVALDIVIGLSFIYVLYSLFATIITEMIASGLSLRARNLENAIIRMLKDERRPPWLILRIKAISYVFDLINDIIKFLFKRQSKLSKLFFEQPSIKYLSAGYSSKPSYLSAENFSKALVDVLKDLGKKNQNSEIEKVRKGLRLGHTLGRNISVIRAFLLRLDKKSSRDIGKKYIKLSKTFKLDQSPSHTSPNNKGGKTSSTVSHIHSLLEDSNGDMIKFREALESWFDDTMLRCTGWYKRKSKIITFSVGLVIAILFNADTIRIVEKLAVDNKARTQLVEMAKTYVKENPNLLTDTTEEKSLMRETVQKMDTALHNQIDQANLLIGGWPELPKEKLKIQFNVDTTKAELDSLEIHSRGLFKGLISFIPSVKKYSKTVMVYYNRNDSSKIVTKENNPDSLLFKDWIQKSYRRTYFHPFRGGFPDISSLEPARVSLPFDKFWKNPWGFIATAFAISLGANFWFDLLNKLVKLRSSVAIPNSQEAAKPRSKKKEIIKG